MLLIVVYLTGFTCLYWALRSPIKWNTETEVRDSFGMILMLLLFWWILLPALAVRGLWKFSVDYLPKRIAREHKESTVEIRSGTDNGLYE